MLDKNDNFIHSSKYETGLDIRTIGCSWTQEDYNNFISRIFYIDIMIKNNKIITDINIHVDNSQFTLKALWDTGATKSVIDISIVKKFNLLDNGKSGGIISDIHNNETSIKLHNIVLSLPYHNNSFPIEVASHDISNKCCEIIIGMDIIKFGSFKLENEEFSFEIHSLK